MANQKGGYRQPANPAPVSGPGAMSRRTDGGATEGMQPATQAPKYMAGLGYGQGGNMEQQQGAPIAANPVPKFPTPTVPLSAPTQRPEEPVTSGVDIGAGPGSEAMPAAPAMGKPTGSAVMRKIAQYDSSGSAELLYRMLADGGY